MNIRSKLILLLLTVLLIQLGYYFYINRMCEETFNHEEALIAKSTHTIKIISQIETLAVRQIDAWKNVLLMGDDPQQYYRYLRQFYDFERQVQGALKGLKSDYSSDAVRMRELLDSLLNIHSEMARSLRESLRLYNESTGNSATAAELATIEIQNRFLSELENLNRQWRKNLNNELAGQHRAIKLRNGGFLLGTLAFLTALSGLFFYSFDKYVWKPLQNGKGAETS